MQSILSLENISYSYHNLNGETPALSNITFRAAEGEFLAIVGPSGCGKSTLLSIIAGLLKPESGVLSFSRASTIGYMLQRDHLFEWRTIYQNVILGLELKKSLNEENTQYVLQLLKDYGLYSFKDKKPSELSGGMRQRAALIRTMAIRPDLLLLDEPFSALDFQTRMTVSADIGNIIRNTGKTAILITHDLSEAITLADRVLVLSKRPATIKCELPVHYDIERTSPLSIRNTEVYQTYFNFLWKELSDDLSDKKNNC
ncbi:MAG: ABC transporter ATP-binding protein [Lachnospiraceae bacterium]|jgi:NitT/TauT family transport system ATP-binding protein|nr:ABC transporter ATP-binding protein [Lachnospiraceae bacterium]